MGACYSVFCKIKYNIWNEDKVLARMKACYQQHKEAGVNFCEEKYPFKEPTSVKDYMELYFTSHQNMFTLNKKHLKNDNMIYETSSAFDASYGWHGVMWDLFDAVAEFLMRGSRLNINDDGNVTYRIKDGEIYAKEGY
jgi:hypothetical protein